MDENCGNCKYYEPINDSHRYYEDDGHCNRYPPTVMQIGNSIGYYYPKVFGKSYCGEFIRITAKAEQEVKEILNGM